MSQMQNATARHTSNTSAPNQRISLYDIVVMPTFFKAIRTPTTVEGIPIPIVIPLDALLFSILSKIYFISVIVIPSHPTIWI